MKVNRLDRARDRRRRYLAVGASAEMELPLLLRTEEIAHIFGVTTETVRVWISDGKLRGRKLNGYWRVARNDPYLVELAQSHRAKPGTAGRAAEWDLCRSAEPDAAASRAATAGPDADTTTARPSAETRLARLRRIEQEAASIGYVVRRPNDRRPRGGLRQQVLAVARRYLDGELSLDPGTLLTPYRIAHVIAESGSGGPPSTGAVYSALRQLAAQGEFRVQRRPFAVEPPRDSHPSI